MIEEVLIGSHVLTGRTTVTFFPERGISKGRDYVEPTRASRKRLEKVIHSQDYSVFPYLRKGRIVIWIAR